MLSNLTLKRKTSVLNGYEFPFQDDEVLVAQHWNVLKIIELSTLKWWLSCYVYFATIKNNREFWRKRTEQKSQRRQSLH